APFQRRCDDAAIGKPPEGRDAVAPRGSQLHTGLRIDDTRAGDGTTIGGGVRYMAAVGRETRVRCAVAVRGQRRRPGESDAREGVREARMIGAQRVEPHVVEDRKSTRLNSSHVKISYAVFCLKK